MNIKELEDKAEEYLSYPDEPEQFVIENLEVFYNLNFIIIRLFEKDFRLFEKEINPANNSKISFYEIIELLNEFYQKINISFDVSKLYNNGTIDYKFFDYDDSDKFERFRLGFNYYDHVKNKKSIIVCNNGYITDAEILVHELSHYRNNMEGGRNAIALLFTETLALTDEFIFHDFLINKGYKMDSNFFKSSFSFFYENSEITVPIMELLMLYKNMGSLSKESFYSFYNTTTDYESDLEYLEDMPLYASLMNTVSYTLSCLLAPYLYYKYKNTNSYKFLDELNSMIMKKDMNLDKCFEYIGLENLDSDIKVLYKSMSLFKREKLK